MMTNAQAALLAACTQFAGAEVDVDPGTVQGMAARYKGWLDRKDREDQEHAREQLASMPILNAGMFSRGGVDPRQAANRHPDGVLQGTTTCPVCLQGPGQPCVTDPSGVKLLHGHVILVEN